MLKPELRLEVRDNKSREQVKTVSSTAERVPLEAVEGEVRVFVKHCGHMPHMDKFFQHRYYGTTTIGSTKVERFFFDAEFHKAGWYSLPEDQWGEGTEQFEVECDACGCEYDAMGRVGTMLECPLCGTEDKVEGMVYEDT
jgi:hypothetical protein